MGEEPNVLSRATARVLVVDEVAAKRRWLMDVLRREGFSVREAESITAAEGAIREYFPNLVLMDVALPDGSGIEFARRVKDRGGKIAVIILTRVDGVDETVAGLAVADDYVTRHLSSAELVARVRAILRRSPDASEGVLRFADLVLSEQTHEVSRGGRIVELTPREFDLLHFLMLNPRRVLTKDQILAQVWHSAGDAGNGSAVETYVSYLRKKLDAAGPPLIRTVRLVGYVLDERAS